MRSLTISSPDKTYTVSFTDHIPSDGHILIDNALSVSVPYKSLYRFSAIEKNKTFDEIGKYIRFLIQEGIQKNDKIIVIGGGLVQDIGCFTASILLRGIEWVFVPTTLLAMADSCIGSKSGINAEGYKNQIGCFHSPSAVYVNTRYLETLPKNEFINGIGEMKKHFIIDGSLLNGDPLFIRESLMVKKKIIEQDYFGLGIRKILNYGHTFGHALEGYTNNKFSHGKAVLWGMNVANTISHRLKILSSTSYLKLQEYIKAEHIDIDSERLMEFIKRDKKIMGDFIDLIIPYEIGDVRVERMKVKTVGQLLH